MTDFKSMREKLGLSQEQMAGLLSVERGLLSMEEVNKRSLPTQAVLRWSLLFRAFETGNLTMGTKAMAALEPTALEKKPFQRKLAACETTLFRLRLALQLMQEKYEQCQKALQAVAFLYSKPPMVQLTEVDIAFLNYLEHVKISQLIKYGTTAQLQLKIKIGKLEYEATELRKWLGGVSFL